jgi:hypothetical protein
MNAANRTKGAGDGVRRSTGRDRKEWFALLDKWGAPRREYREIADWLTGKHDLSSWWAQKLIVEYEQARGLRGPGVRPDGTFSVGASKTVAVPVERLYEAFVDPKERKRWLPGAVMRLRSSQPGRRAHFDWEDGATRVNVEVSAKGEARSQVAVEHVRLPDARAGEERKQYWREQLVALKDMLERTTP